MRRMSRRGGSLLNRLALGLTAGLLAIGGSGAAASAAPSTTAPTHTVKPAKGIWATGDSLPDPGIGHFLGRFYIYGTTNATGVFPEINAAAWNGPYSAPAPTMTGSPSWTQKDCTVNGVKNRAEWAPQVFYNGSTYVMYYSACNTAGLHCLGVATSHSPGGPFTPNDATKASVRTSGYCAPAAAGSGAEAIDPDPFPEGKDWYMLFKTSLGNKSKWKIWAVDMSTNGLSPTGKAHVVFTENYIAEAPDLVRHGNDLWLFLARNTYSNCSYETQAWEATSFTNVLHGEYAKSVTVLDNANTGLCGPGGTSVFHVGNSYYMAFAAHPNKSSGTIVHDRQTYVAQLTWKAGSPQLKS